MLLSLPETGKTDEDGEEAEDRDGAGACGRG